MKILNRARGAGKTLRMIYASEVTGYRIITPTRSMAEHVKSMAEKLGCNIPEPASVDEWRDTKRHSVSLDCCGVLIDEAKDIIDRALVAYLGCPVHAVSISVDMAPKTHDIRIVEPGTEV